MEVRGTSRQAQRLATRERLFAAAVVEFKRAGLAGADVGAIVDEAGVAHGTFFFHFPTKEHVLAELGQREEARLARELDRFLAVKRDLRAVLREVLRLAAALERRLGKQLFKDLIALYFSPHRDELRLWADHPLIARVVTEFTLARDRGEIVDHPDVDPAAAAVLFFVGFFAVLVTFDRTDREPLLEQSISLLLRGLERS